MLASGARRLAALYGVAVGERAVVTCVSDAGLHAAAALDAVGVPVAAVADLRPDAAERPAGAAVVDAGIELLAGHTVVRAVGRDAVSGALLARVDANGLAQESSIRKVGCDLLAVDGGSVPASSLLLQAEPARATTRRAAASFGRAAAHGLGGRRRRRLGLARLRRAVRPPGRHAGGALARDRR